MEELLSDLRQSNLNASEGDIYDVAICGGGLAGSTLARQLKLEMQKISIIVLDRLGSPLPEAAFKVGESTVEVGAFYLAKAKQYNK